jgi:hypothetical protein
MKNTITRTVIIVLLLAASAGAYFFLNCSSAANPNPSLTLEKPMFSERSTVDEVSEKEDFEGVKRTAFPDIQLAKTIFHGLRRFVESRP